MGQIVQTMMTLTQLQKNKYECNNSTFSSEFDSSSSSSSNSEDKLSTNSIEDIEEQLQHTSNNNENINISTNLEKNNNKDIHSVSENYIPAILPKRPWGEFSILHYTDTSSNMYSSLPAMIHSLDIRNNSYSTPNTPPSTTSVTSPSYTIPAQESILSESDDDEDHQDYDDSIAMDDIIKMMEETHLGMEKNVPNLCKSSSPSSSSSLLSFVENKNKNIKNISHPSINKLSSSSTTTKILNSQTMIPISSNISTIDDDIDNKLSKVKKDITNPSTFLPSDFQFSFNIEKNETQNEQQNNPPFMVTPCASPFTLKYRKILPMPKSRIKKLNNENVSPEKTTSSSSLSPTTINNQIIKPNFLNKEQQQQYNFTTMSSVNSNNNNNGNNNNNSKSNSNNNDNDNDNSDTYNYEDDTMYDHTKKVKRTNHYINSNEKFNMNFNKTLNEETTININHSSPLLASSPDKTKKINKKNTPSSTINNNNNNNNNRINTNTDSNNKKKKKNNTLIPPLSSSLSIQKKKNSKSGNNLPNLRQTLSTSTSGSTKSTNTIPSSSTIPKNRNNNKNKNKNNSTKKKLTKTSSTTPEGHRRLRQQQNQQQQQDPFTTNLITPLDTTTTDWVCLFCQYEIFMKGWIMTQKKKKLAQKRGSRKMKNKLKHQHEEEVESDEYETRSCVTYESENEN